MSDYVLLTKNGFIPYENEKPITRKTLIPELRERVELIRGVRAIDLMKAVRQDESLEKFVGMYSNCNGIKAWNNLAHVKPSRSRGMLEFCWHAEKTDKDQLHLWPVVEGKEDGEDGGRFGIELMDIQEVAGLKLSIDDEVTLVAKDEKEKEFEVKLGTKPFTLLELIDAFYWEIGWFGDPTKREKTKKFFEERVEKIRKELMDAGSLSDGGPADAVRRRNKGGKGKK